MEMPKDYEETEGITGDYETLEAGGYICKIVVAKAETSQAGNEMLVLALDIAEGEHAGYFQRKFEQAKKQNTDVNKKIKWSNNGTHRIMKLDKEGKCNKFFKGFGTIIEESNPGYKWTGNEESLKDKVLGCLFGEEEYEKTGGDIGTAVKAKFIRSVACIKEGKFAVPEIKRLERKENAFSSFQTVSGDTDDDLPF